MSQAVTEQQLIDRAMAARDQAYAPYSNFEVGCALVAGGQIYVGGNVENASYGLTICAERNAVAAAVLAGAGPIELAVVATKSSPPAPPCGMCLQTLNEFAPDPTRLRILLVNPQGERQEFTLADLLPRQFSNKQLPSRS